METAFEYCANYVRDGDVNRFTAAGFAQSQSRRHLIALYAFNLEVAKTREIVSEPMLGEIRLQWWREAIGEIYNGRPRQHLVVEALAQVIGAHDLPRDLFDNLINARALDLEDSPFKTMADLDAYLMATSAGLMSLAMGVLAPESSSDAADLMAVEAGRAWALTGLICALPYRAAQGQSIIPEDLAAQAGLDPHALFAGRMHPGLRQSVDDLAARAEESYAPARKLAKEVPSKLWPAFLQIGLIPSYLKTCRADDFLQAPESPPLWRRQFRLLQCMIFGQL